MSRVLQCFQRKAVTHAPFRRKRFIDSRRWFRTSSCFLQPQFEDFTAAPELDFSNPVLDHEIPLLKRIRVIPASPSHFSTRAKFNDAYLVVEKLWLETKSLPHTVEPTERVWITFQEMKKRLPLEKVKKPRFDTMIERLNELNQIEPVLMPEQVKEVIETYSKQMEIVEANIRNNHIDEWGRSLGIGKRKSSVARVYLLMGDGQVLINNRNLSDYFGRLHDRESALWPLKITSRIDRYNVFGIVNGGGLTGQAEAMTLAVAKALLAHEPELKSRLEDAGCLYRDPRTVERKKPGRRKARKAPQWVKR